MKKLLFATICTLSLATLATPALANEVAAIEGISTTRINKITPHDLVTGAYQGRYSDRGIPQAYALISATSTSRIKAEDLVKAAIADGRLPQDTINDRSYLQSVKRIINGLGRN